MSGATYYRRLLRASRELFHGDALALRESRAALRREFEAKRGERDPARLREAYQAAEEAEDFLRNNLVQAKRTKKDTYAVQLKPVQGGAKHTDVEPARDPAAAGASKPPGSKDGAGCCSI